MNKRIVINNITYNIKVKLNWLVEKELPLIEKELYTVKKEILKDLGYNNTTLSI